MQYIINHNHFPGVFTAVIADWNKHCSDNGIHYRNLKENWRELGRNYLEEERKKENDTGTTSHNNSSQADDEVSTDSDYSSSHNSNQSGRKLKKL